MKEEAKSIVEAHIDRHIGDAYADPDTVTKNICAALVLDESFESFASDSVLMASLLKAFVSEIPSKLVSLAAWTEDATSSPREETTTNEALRKKWIRWSRVADRPFGLC